MTSLTIMVLLFAVLLIILVDWSVPVSCAAADFVPNLGAFTYDQLGARPYNVSYDNRSITINGERIFLISSGIHYPRSSPSMWPQIFEHVKASGANCIQSYFFHNYHERFQGVWDWSTESRNLAYFLQLAAEHGLFVTLRLGVYVDAEWWRTHSDNIIPHTYNNTASYAPSSYLFVAEFCCYCNICCCPMIGIMVVLLCGHEVKDSNIVLIIQDGPIIWVKH